MRSTTRGRGSAGVVADDDGAVERGPARRRGAPGSSRCSSSSDVPGGHRVARLGPADHPGRRADHVLLAGPARARAARRRCRPPGRRGRDGAALRGADLLHVLRARQGGVGVAALGAHHHPPASMARPVGQRLGRVGVDADEGEHLARQGQRHLDHVGRAAALQHLDRLGHLEPVAGRPAERCVHVGEQGGGAHAVAVAQPDHRARPARGPRPRSCMNAPDADLHVEHQGAGALGDLLAT